MTLEKLADIITADTKQHLTELEIVQKIIALSEISIYRAIDGYKLLRQKGLINHIVKRDSVGSIDMMMDNDQMRSILLAFDAIPIKLHILKPIRNTLKPSSYQPNEIMPGTKMSRVEVSDYLARSLRPYDESEFNKKIASW